MKDKKQLTQLVALGVLLAVFVGYFVVKLSAGKPNSAPPAASTRVQNKPEAKPAGTGAGPTVSVAATPSIVARAEVGEVAPGQQQRDPFLPMMDTEADLQHQNTRVRTARWVPPVTPTNYGPLPTFGAGASSQGPGTASVQPAEEAFPQFVVTGVITGQTNVAIIRLGEGRYVVREGQRINGIYQVVSVSQAGVLLSRSGKSVFLKLGGDGNAS